MESNIISKQVFIHSQHTKSYYSIPDAPCVPWQINNTTIVLQIHTSHPAVSGFLHLSDINHFTKCDCLRTITKMMARSRSSHKSHTLLSTVRVKTAETQHLCLLVWGYHQFHISAFTKNILKQFASTISERILNSTSIITDIQWCAICWISKE